MGGRSPDRASRPRCGHSRCGQARIRRHERGARQRPETHPGGPVIAGENHARPAIEAGRAVLAAVEGLAANGLLVGAGVHAGEAFVGAIGSGERTDFTALGDTVNVAARLGALAGPRELLVSRVAWDGAELGEPPAVREVGISGRSDGLAVVPLVSGAPPAPPAG